MEHTYIGLMEVDFLQSTIGAHSKGGPEVRGERERGVAASLEHTLPLSLAVLDIPVVYCTVSTTADQVRVIRRPLHTAHLRTTPCIQVS